MAILRSKIRARRGRRPSSGSSGFSLIEVLIAMLVLTTALLAVLALVTNTVAAMKFAQDDLIAKQKGREIIESILSARNTGQITFIQIKNVSAGGIFLDGLQPLRTAGADGLLGTADDGAIETESTPGPDGLFGTPDDVTQQLTNFQRSITITPVLLPSGAPNPDLNQLNVTVQYEAPTGFFRTFQVVSYVSQYR
jgi:prepilin-type N-terminal cleavage/methylation domain-containing protein